MPQYIMKLQDRYAMWSTIVDAPITEFLPLEEFTELYRRRYGQEGLDTFSERMARVEANGISALDESIEGVLCVNRAGENESHITPDEILQRYTPANGRA